MDDQFDADLPEGDVCRVCRLEAEPDNPLYHPCRCSGTIRNVHSDCLVQWLGHSGKKTCELCGYPFGFKKFYPADMPSTLPPLKLARKFLMTYLMFFLLGLRAIVVAFAWLAFLPLVAISLWRALFVAGGGAAFWLAGIDSDPTTLGQNATQAKAVTEAAKHVVANLTETAGGAALLNGTKVMANATEVGNNVSAVVKGSLFQLIQKHGFRAVGRAMTKAIYRQLTRPDMTETIFKGQIITIGMVVTFLSVFLLREWIFQVGPNPAEPEEVDVQDPPKAEEFKPEMAVKWRKARKRDEVGTQILVGDGVAGLANDPVARILEERRMVIGILGENVVRNILDAPPERDLMAAPAATAEGPDASESAVLANFLAQPLEPSGRDDDEEWEDVNETDEATNAARKRRKEDRMDEAQRERLRRARNQYFDDQARNGESSKSGGSSSKTDLAASANATHAANAEAGPSSSGLNAPVEPVGPRRSPRLGKQAVKDSPSTELSATADPVQVDNRADETTEAAPAEWEDVIEPEEPRVEQLDPIIGPDPGNQDEDQEEVEEVEEGPEPVNEDEFDDIPPGEEGGIIMEGDVEGIMIAIGMQGPAIAIFQNVLLINVVLASALCVLIHVPYTIGKTHLLANVSIPLTLIKFPIRIIRLITDPVIDVVLDMFDVVVLQSLGLNVKNTTESMAVRGEAALPSVDSLKALAFNTLRRPLQVLGMKASEDAVVSASAATVLPFPLSLAEDQFARLGSLSGWAWKSGVSTITQLGASSTPAAKTIAISLGYVDLLLAATAVVHYGERVFGENGKAIADTIREHSDLLKLGLFMSIELAFFPLGMGYCLDLCTLPLFPEGTLQYRLEAHAKHKILGLFGHWLCGTHFMFAFAKFLSVCRSLCRRGAMYIIRDPSDPSFSPVKDILGKNSRTQLYKLCISAAMYLSVLGGPLGGILWLIRHQRITPPLLPLRWAYQTPMAQIPIDIILLLFVIPRHVRRVKLDPVFKAYCRYLWSGLSKFFRLSSYMRGVRYREQEEPRTVERVLLRVAYNVTYRICLLLRKTPPKADSFEGGLMRVPYADQVVLVRPRKGVFVPVDDNGIPLTEEGKIIALTQDRAARKGNRSPNHDYCMVYLPPFYRLRFWAFGISVWTAVSFALVLAICLPVAVGRAVLNKLSVVEDFHDGYSFIVGGYTLYALFVIGWYAGKRSNSIFVRVAATPRYRDPWTPWKGLFKMSSALMHTARRAYVVFTVMLCMPIGIGIALELYILQPLKYGISDMTPVIYPFEAWSYGLMVMSLVYLRRDLRHSFLHLIGRHEMVGGFFSFALQPRNVNRQLLLPVTARLLVLCGGPAMLSVAVTKLTRMSVRESEVFFRFIYPWTLCIILLYYLHPTLIRSWSAWSLAALEQEYLVEKRVLNIEDEEAARQAAKAGSKFPTSRMDGVVRAVDGVGVQVNGIVGEEGVGVGPDGVGIAGLPVAQPRAEDIVGVGPVDPELEEDQRILNRVRAGTDFAEAIALGENEDVVAGEGGGAVAGDGVRPDERQAFEDAMEEALEEGPLDLLGL